MTSSLKVIEIVGEGKADIGKVSALEEPESGIIVILVHKLCGTPKNMKVKRRAAPHIQSKGGWAKKVKFAKQQALYNKSAGLVFVLDSEGDLKQTLQKLEKGRDAAYKSFPMAIGVAHPCIETWLLADSKAIRKGLDLRSTPTIPECPEDLPAPQKDRDKNPKTILAAFASERRTELSSSEKDKIALAIMDTELLRSRCPKGFAPFADEVEKHIKPLFDDPPK